MYQKQLWGTAVALETYKAGEATLRSLINGYTVDVYRYKTIESI